MIKDELKILCVMYAEQVSGTIQIIYEEDGSLRIDVDHNDNDFMYDEIGSVLEVKRIQRERRELFEALETYYKVVFLGEGI